jgi:N-acetyl-alpha-D-muramate 1-phosphate uridylyltransferase
MTMLERVALRLIEAGAERIVINTHHFPERIEEVVRERNGFGVDVRVSHEAGRPLDTAGGLMHAAHLFRRDRPILLHNCDVVSDLDLRALYDAHQADDDAMATLAVLPPSPERYLIFDNGGFLGYAPRSGGDDVHARPAVGEVVRRDFMGIHVVSPELLDTLDYQQPYSIILHYLRLAKDGSRVGRHEQEGVRWIDIGTHDKLALAREMVGM